MIILIEESAWTFSFHTKRIFLMHEWNLQRSIQKVIRNEYFNKKLKLKRNYHFVSESSQFKAINSVFTLQSSKIR